MSRRRAWIAVAIGLLAVALAGMHALPAQAASAAHGCPQGTHAMGVAGNVATMSTASMGSCGEHHCVSHRLATSPAPHSGPARSWMTAAVTEPSAPISRSGTPYRARPPPRAGGGAGLGVWRQ